MWGFSGEVGLQQILRPSLESAHRPDWRRKPLLELRSLLAEPIAGVRRAVVAQLLVANQIPGAESIFVGATGAPAQERPWILECPNNNVPQEHFKFCAIGSGKKAAYHGFESLRHYEPHEQPIGVAKLFLYRIMEDAIRAESAGVGGLIHLWSVTRGGAAEEPAAEIQGLAQTVDQWRSNERGTLRDLMRPTGRDEDAEPNDGA